MSLLEQVNSPADLKTLPRDELPVLAEEIRMAIVEVVSQTGGHLAPSLGAVELAIAIHYVFDTPREKVIWDVGHQAYPHKILTGRRDRLGSIRQLDGLAPFPTRFESEYDTFGAGHSSTSISAALGFAVARDLGGVVPEGLGDAIAVIGDGAMSAGMAFEALILQRLQRVPTGRRQEWLRGLLVQGFVGECRGRREANDAPAGATKPRQGTSFAGWLSERPPVPQPAPAPKVDRCDPRRSADLDTTDKPFAHLRKVIG